MKLGLALSGGGLRAALFHVGVLAQMAQLALLRHLEAISTVSGGSIIGALYYLHVKRLLENKTDQEISDHDYLNIISDIEHDFLGKIQRNLRSRTFLNPLVYLRNSNPLHLFSTEMRQLAVKRGGVYSRTDRLGELLDEYLYRPVLSFNRPVAMRDLKISPRETPTDPDPAILNHTRSAKIPTLLINATVLNSGHNWRFESHSMGVPQRTAHAIEDIDRNLKLCRPPSYGAMPARFRDFPLGRAVAASAAVPGLFPPVTIHGLYPGDIWVELIDGGIHDNQGIQGLIDLGCTHFVVSDASGQMEDDLDPPTNPGAVLNRMTSVLMDRLREEQLLRLIKAEDPPVAFVHLRKGLPAQVVQWIGPDGKPADTGQRTVAGAQFTSLRIAPEVQELLARVRTDLDSFTEVEASSLMLEGYQIGEAEFRRAPGIGELIVTPASLPNHRWRFLHIEPWALRPTPKYLRELRVAGHRLFKIFRLSWPVTVTTFALVVILAWILVVVLPEKINYEPPSREEGLMFCVIFIIIAVSVFLSIFGVRTRRLPWLAKLIARPPTPGGGTFFIWPVAWIHLVIFDRLFLRQGQVSKLGPPPTEMVPTLTDDTGSRADPNFPQQLFP